MIFLSNTLKRAPTLVGRYTWASGSSRVTTHHFKAHEHCICWDIETEVQIAITLGALVLTKHLHFYLGAIND